MRPLALALLSLALAAGCESSSGAPDAGADVAPGADAADALTGSDGGDVADALTGSDGGDVAAGSDAVPGADAAASDAAVPGSAALGCTATVADAFPAQAWRVGVVPTSDGWRVTGYRALLHSSVEAPPDSVPPGQLDALTEGTFAATGIRLTFAGGSLDLGPDPTADTGFWTGTLSLPLADGGELRATCWSGDLALGFAYDAASGRCVSGDGGEGRNRLPIGFVREMGSAVCADLAGVALEEGDYSYPTLAGWDLRGAGLRQASLHFADLLEADLRGADLTELDFGYARVTGTVDAHTLPQPLPGETDGRIDWLQ
jgi:hypothetical protein